MSTSEKHRLEGWKVQSPETPGFHPVVVPGKNECRVAHVYRLNMSGNSSHVLHSGNLEMNAVLLSGKASLSDNLALNQSMDKFDSFYIPANTSVKISSANDSIFYIGGAPYEGIGETSFRKYDPNLPIGDVHQIHGEGVGRREVMFTLPPQTPASRLICGLNAQHSPTLHRLRGNLYGIRTQALAYRNSNIPPQGLFRADEATSSSMRRSRPKSVSSGTMIEAPCGYHPTVASPGTRNAYFWVLASFSAKQRRYDLAVLDPVYAASN